MEQLLSRTKGDKVIWGVVIILSLISLLAVYSSTSSLAYRLNKGHTEVYLIKQLLTLATGILIIYVCHKLNYIVYSRFAVILFIISVPLLIYTLYFGTELNQGSRWIKLPFVPITFQSSDLAKLALFMFLARQLSRMRNNLDDFKKVAINIFLPVIIICALIAPANLSTALMTAMSSTMLFFIGQVRIKHLMILAATAFILLGGLITISYYLKVGRAVTWVNRIQHFKSNDKKETPFQVYHSKIAIAKGGLLGKGPGNSTQRNFLPHPYSDFIYSIIIEEYGLVGGIALIFIYLLFLWRSILIFRRCPYAFGAYLAL